MFDILCHHRDKTVRMRDIFQNNMADTEQDGLSDDEDILLFLLLIRRRRKRLRATNCSCGRNDGF
jgi:hypothetical protein